MSTLRVQYLLQRCLRRDALSQIEIIDDFLKNGNELDIARGGRIVRRA
jgi:hypothetical protein